MFRPSLACCATLFHALALLPAGSSAQLWQARDQVLAHESGFPGEEAVSFGFALAAGDWNGDGFSDLVCGDPDRHDGGGATEEFDGSPTGLDLASSVGSLDGQRRGQAIAIADFDGDGFDDAAIGEPAYVESGIAEGRVLIYRSGGTILTFDTQFLQSTAGVPGAPENGDEFGFALATGNFNGDAYADLAIGVPGEDVGEVADAGAAVILYGSADGLTVTGAQIWHFATEGVPESPGEGDRLGAALASYRPDCDAFHELAIGAPGRAVDGLEGAGAVVLLNGTEAGLGGPIGVLDQLDVFMNSVPFAGEAFGAALADADNLDFAACGSLLIGAPGERVGLVSNAGAVFYYYATVARYTQEDFGTTAESGDRFGAALAVADFDDDGFMDVAIGSPGEAFQFETRTGAVHVLFSNGGDPDPSTAQFLFQRHGLEIEEEFDSGGEFGAALAAGDWNGDGVADLAIGAPTAETDGDLDRGAVVVLYGALFAADFEDGAFGEWSSHTPE